MKLDGVLQIKKECSCSAPLAAGEMQIKAPCYTIRLLSEWQKWKHSDNSKCWWRCREMGVLVPCQGECRMSPPFWKRACWFLLKLSTHQPRDPAIDESLCLQEHCMWMGIKALFVVVQTRNNPYAFQWVNG